MTDRQGVVDEEREATASLLTVAEAARYLGLGRKVIYQLIERGEVCAVKLGRSTRLEKKSLDKFKAGGRLA